MEVSSESGTEKRPIKMPLPLFDQSRIDHKKQRYPNCIVWTPIPCLTWLFPIIGHMGIATSAGIIRDFAGPYFVSEDDMAFGKPTKFYGPKPYLGTRWQKFWYWQLETSKVARKGQNSKDTWDMAVYDASEEYKTRMHNLCCDNCHSHCAMALNIMEYGGSRSWNMVKLCFFMLVYGKYVSFCGFLKTWLPFLIMAGGIITLAIVFS